MSRFKELAKNTLIITIGKVSTQLITFLLLPLYTAVLSTEEYGTVDLITTLVQLFIPVVSLMIDQGVFRYLLDCKTENEYKQNISSAFFCLLYTNCIFFIIYLIISFFVNNNYKIWVLLILIVNSFSNLFLQIARGLKKTSDYAIGSFICSSSTIILNVLGIVAFKMGAIGMLSAVFLGNLICCIFLYIKLKLNSYISFENYNKKLIKQQIKYSLPLIPNQLSLWIMNSSDRLIVTYFLGMSANGILAISHKFPAVFMTFYNIFQLAWHETGTIHFKDEDRESFFSEMFDTIISIFSTLCIGIIICLPICFNVLINNEFFEAYYNVPIYMIAFLFNIVIGFFGVIYIATQKTSEIAKTTIISALINIFVNILFINKIGLYAASISTFVGYLITMIYRILDSNKYIKIKYNIKRLLMIIILIIISIFIYYINNKLLSLIYLILFLPIGYILNKKMIQGIILTIRRRHDKSELFKA